MLARLTLALVKVLAGLDVIFETSPIDLGGTSLTKMALEYVLQIGMLKKFLSRKLTYLATILNFTRYEVTCSLLLWSL